ncbi:patatin-like phospholipase family protein [Rhodocytophaga aerolata]|uniref:Patatin-like phospholipase family protein n=1 Tax=Rhodocytophaga aerolata TaxID=455078 RepID=A0ABT8RBW9_9BACT|nr:patatin-like phospholipase family protein [Rhodocytophaga aerolata]MDO1449565.1 patatin-like phospholipase family protein [Rhodocytophaga aerolata]
MNKLIAPVLDQFPNLAPVDRMPVHALVISGGGALGALGGGTLARLNKDYQIISGVSTGSLLSPLVALREWDRLREAYTTVTQKDIFTYNPFKADGKIHIWKAIWRILQGKTTLGDSSALRKTIKRFFSQADFECLQQSGKQIIVACQETSREPEQIHHFSSLDCSYEDMVDYLWFSANAPGVMSIGYKNGGEWCDGGVTELLSLKKVIQMGATHVDVIIHRCRRNALQKSPAKDFFHNVFRLADIMRHEIEANDLETGLLYAHAYKVKVNVYWIPEKLTNNSLIFDKAKMNAWWQLGYNTALDEKRIDRYSGSILSEAV